MTGYLLRRAVASCLLLLLVLTLTFFLLHLAPGDPALLLQDPRVPREQQQRLREIWGLDRPLAEQYLIWLGSVALRFDWGTSFTHHRPVTAVVADALPSTLLLGGAALAVEFVLGLALGVAAARRAGARADHLIRIGSLVLYSLPLFWLGLMAIFLFSHLWPIFPAGHMRSVESASLAFPGRLLDLVRHLALPCLVLGVASAGGIARFVRNSLLEALGQDYVWTARAKGLAERRVVWVHGLRNALSPVLQILGLSLPFLLSGSLVVEVVFSWPGLGRVAYGAVLARDYPVILATTALTGTLVIAGNLVADLLHAAADPRVRHA